MTITGDSGPVQLDLKMVSDWVKMLHGSSKGYLHICSKGNWAGKTFLSLKPLLNYVKVLDDNGAEGIYLRSTSLHRALDLGQRGSDADTRSWPGLFADMDIAGPGHKPTKKLPLPPDLDACKEILEEAQLPEPTLWIFSGGGYYPWWLLEEAVQVDDGNLEALQAVSGQWQNIIKAAAQRLGYHYGPVGDLSRVLRLPGTVNRKVPGAHQLCRILDNEGTARRFGDDELDSFLFYAAKVMEEKTPKPEPVAPVTPSSGSTGLRPGDAYNQQATWEQVLDGSGWQHMYDRGVEGYWCRPGKNPRDGHSATTNYGNSNLFYVFTTDADGFESGESYSKFRVYSILNHGGDDAAAAKDLGTQGFGEPLLTRQERNLAELDRIKPMDVSFMNAGGEVAVPEEKVTLDISNPQEAMDCVRRAIIRGNVPGLYVQEGHLVEILPVSGSIEGTNSYLPVHIQAVTPDSLIRIMGEKTRLVKMVKRKEEWSESPAMLTATVAKAVLTNTYWPGVPPLQGIVTTPTLRVDGSLLQTPGYDQESQLFYHPRLEMEPIPDRPALEEVQEARRFITDDVLGDFPWQSKADLANYIALMFSPILRPYINALMPMGVLSARSPGSGKTLLAKIPGEVCGMYSMSWVPDEAEARKAISTGLSNSQHPIMLFDNVGDTEKVNHACLAKLLTSRSWDDRLLGTNKSINARNDRLWLVTGNNVSLGGDIASRSVLVTIDPGIPNPELRDNFRLGDLEEWLTDESNRIRLLRAMLVMVQAWRNAGAVKVKTPMRGFTAWASMMAGFTAFHGYAGFLGNLDEVKSQDVEAEEWVQVCSEIHKRYGSGRRTAGQMTRDALSAPFDDPWHELLRDVNAKQWGWKLKARQGRFFGNWRLCGERDKSQNQTLWWVEKIE